MDLKSKRFSTAALPMTGVKSGGMVFENFAHFTLVRENIVGTGIDEYMGEDTRLPDKAEAYLERKGRCHMVSDRSFRQRRNPVVWQSIK